jgi:hypothetical protein
LRTDHIPERESPERTKAALAIRKASGGKPGNPTNSREAGENGRASLIAAAADQARCLLPLLRTLKAQGTITLRAVTRALTSASSRRRVGWHVSSAANLLARASKLEAIR